MPIVCYGTGDHGRDGLVEASGVRGTGLVVGEQEMHSADERGGQRGNVGGGGNAAEFLLGGQVGTRERGPCCEEGEARGPGAKVPAPPVCLEVHGELAGWVDYDVRRSWLSPGEVNVGYALFPTHRHRGYATRAVQLLCVISPLPPLSGLLPATTGTPRSLWSRSGRQVGLEGVAQGRIMNARLLSRHRLGLRTAR